MADEQLTPITPARVAQELKALSAGRASGKIPKDEYEHRFSRMISELRDRRISGTRAEIMAELTPLKADGTISDGDWMRLVKQLGLA
ncbi:MAG: hypothetical protein AB7L66_18370 [Gemmatimonadales bacterium]